MLPLYPRSILGPVVSLLASSMLVLTSGCSQSGSTSATRDAAEAGERPEAGLYNNAVESPLIHLIDAASRTLDVEIYQMQEPKVLKALLRAAEERDVRVRVIIEASPVGAGEGDEEGLPSHLAPLTEAGIEIKPFPKHLCGEGTNCVQHGKLIVADETQALVSTGNFNGSNLCAIASSASRCNRDLTVVINDAPSVRTLAKVFEADFAGDSYDLSAVLESEPAARVTVSPASQKKMLNFVKGATESVELQAQYLKEPQLNTTLKNLAKDGIEVKATVASACSFGRLKDTERERLTDQLGTLADSGVDLKMYTTKNRIAGRSAYMHSKVFLVDGKEAWVGSTNGSRAAFFSNREFGVFFKDVAWVNKLHEIVQGDHESAQNDDWEQNLTCETEHGEG